MQVFSIYPQLIGEIVALWNKLNLGDSDINHGQLVAFLKQIERSC